MICDECETVAHCMKNGCVPKTTKQTEAMKLALEALEKTALIFGDDCLSSKAANALQEALAEQPAPVQEPVQQEPVPLEEYDAGLLNDFGGGNVDWWWDYIRAELGRAYEHYQSQMPSPPAQRTWVHATEWRGLTYEEAKEIYTCIHGYDSSKRIAQAIEAKLKAKNSA